jgi:pimeloyl-ACP methyl ester carboxylesterase
VNLLLAFALLPLALLAGAVSVAAWETRRHKIRLLPDERHVALTQDGWHLALHRYRPRAEGPGRGPVILCHGLLANRANVDLDERRSLARALAAHGLDARVLELRGAGFSRDPKGHRGLGRITFDDYVQRDLPAAIEAVCKETGQAQVQWVGHSMGGMVLYAYLSHREDPRIASAVTIASPVDFRVLARTSRRMLRLRPLLRLRWVPIGLGLRILIPFFERSRTRLLRLGLVESNLRSGDVGDILVNVIEAFGPAPVLAQFGEWVEHGVFRSRDGRCAYGDLTHARCPLLVIAAGQDFVAPPASVHPALDRAPAEEKVYRLFGTSSGDEREFGHGDIVLSDAARESVFPVVAEWLVRHAPSP